MAKLETLVALTSFAALADSAKNFTDGVGVVLARNLEHVTPKIFEQKYPDTTFLQTGITVDNSGGFAEVITKRKQSVQADLNFGGSDRGANKGKISLGREKDTISVYGDTRFSEWTETELKQAKHENINLVTEYIKGHFKVYNELIDKAGYEGVLGNKGLLTYTGFASASASGAIRSLTAQAMYDEFSALIVDQWNGVNNTSGYMANVVVTSPVVINKLSTTMLNTAGSTKSVLKALQDNFAGVKFVGTAKAYDGTSSTAVAIANGEDAVTFRVPQRLTIGEIIKKSSFKYEVESMFRVAGIDVSEDTAGRRLLGL